MLIFKSRFTIAVLLLTALSHAVLSAQLTSVRFGSHQGFDRVVCEVSEPVAYEVASGKNGTIELHLLGVSVGEKFFLPKLPPQIKLLTSVEAFLEGESVIVLEIRGNEPLIANTTELKGHSWRLAMDLSVAADKPAVPTTNEQQTPSTSKSKATPKSSDDKTVPYVPGDRPIETILADKPGQESVPVSQSERETIPDPKLLEQEHLDLSQVSAQVNQPDLLPTEPLAARDSLKALEVLAEFYDVMGDQDAARQYARLYLNRVDSGDALPPVKGSDKASLPGWIFTVIAFAAGIAGGIVGSRVRLPKDKSVWTIINFKLPLPKSSKTVKDREPAEELVEDLDSLSRAVASENSVAARPAPKSVKSEIPAEVAQEVETSAPSESIPNVEADMKESLMDRRVKRVLELHSQNRALADIAQELDMGQDEVKLIIDLNS